MENNETGPKLTNKTCTFLLNNVGKCILFEEQICMSANSDKTPTKRVSKNKTKIEGINPLLKWLPFFEMLRGKNPRTFAYEKALKSQSNLDKFGKIGGPYWRKRDKSTLEIVMFGSFSGEKY